MTDEAGPVAGAGAPHDAAHLDEDAECLEDPVHCGDARHQHDAHSTPAQATVEPGATPQV